MSSINHGFSLDRGTIYDWKISTRAVLWISIAFFTLLILVLEYAILKSTNDAFCYPVDDTFIHLAIAKNIAFHQVWGISPHEFSSAASSVLYPLLLAVVVKTFGAHVILPFIVNMITSFAFILVLQRWLSRQKLIPIEQLGVLLFVIVVIPLPVIALCGMEHTLQLLFCFLFVFTFSEKLEKLEYYQSRMNQPTTMFHKKWSLPWPVYLYGSLLVMTRYEGLVIIATACVILLIYRKVLTSLLLGMISTLPIIFFGIYSIAHGSHFLPNSVLLKSGAPHLTPTDLANFFSKEVFDRLFLTKDSYSIAATQRILILLPLVFLLFRNQIKKASKYKFILILLITAIMAELSLTSWGTFPRYEACIIGNSMIFMAFLFARYRHDALKKMPAYFQWTATLVILFCFIPILMRSKEALQISVQATVNIYEQQYQMGRFMGKYYHDTPIAFNDIGAVSYFTEGHNLDLRGLGNVDIANSFKSRQDNSPLLQRLVLRDSVKVAVIFDRPFSPALRAKWNKIASWQIPNNVICTYDSVSFYAIDQKDGAPLKQNLQDFQPSLPTEVVVRYY